MYENTAVTSNDVRMRTVVTYVIGNICGENRFEHFSDKQLLHPKPYGLSSSEHIKAVTQDRSNQLRHMRLNSWRQINVAINFYPCFRTKAALRKTKTNPNDVKQ